MLELKKLDANLKSQITELGKGRKISDKAGDADEDGDGDAEPKRKRGDDEESEVGDGDADDVKRAKQKTQKATYSDDEGSDDDEEMGAFDDNEIEAAHASESGSESGEDEDDAPKAAKGKSKGKSRIKNLKAEASVVSDLFQRNLQLCTAFEFDSSKCTFKLEVCTFLCSFDRFLSVSSLFVFQFSSTMPKLLLVGIIERTCRATIIREIPGITDCFQVKDDRKDGKAEIKVGKLNFVLFDH